MAELFSQPHSIDDAPRHEDDLQFERAPIPSIEDRIAAMESFDTLGLVEGADYKSDYALRPIAEGFNWPRLLEVTETLNGWMPGCDLKDYRLIVFRSVRKPEADGQFLDLVDKIAFRDAMYRAESRDKAFALYLRGGIDEQGNGLSACLWKRPEDAVEVSKSEAHANAMRVTLSTYSDVILEKHDLNRTNGAIDIQLVDVRQVLGGER